MNEDDLQHFYKTVVVVGYIRFYQFFMSFVNINSINDLDHDHD